MNENVEFTNLCMVRDGGRVLVMDRKKEDWPGITFPGGHVEVGESFTEAVIREARGNLSSVAGNRTTGETPVEVIPETMAPGGSTAGTVEASLTKETPDQTVPPVQTTSEPAQTTAAQTTQAQAANAEASYKVYVVGEGETLYGICFKEYHNIRKLQEICQINSLTDENSIYAGQKLLLP